MSVLVISYYYYYIFCIKKANVATCCYPLGVKCQVKTVLSLQAVISVRISCHPLLCNVYM